jgi:hypothetical protein
MWESGRLEAAPDGEGRRITYRRTNQQNNTNIIELPPVFNNTPLNELIFRKAFTKFNDLYIGDLEWVANNIGMRNSSSCYCSWCEHLQATFGNGMGIVRTRESLDRDYETFKENLKKAIEKKNKTLPTNHNGVSKYPLLKIDPAKLVLPTLHCENFPTVVFALKIRI